MKAAMLVVMKKVFVVIMRVGGRITSVKNRVHVGVYFGGHDDSWIAMEM